MAGYYKNSEATSEKLREGWYDTGDLVRVKDGFFYILGRADDMFICGGENIYPAQVETLLEKHPAVMSAAVVPLPDVRKGQVPVAFVVARQGASIDPAELRQFARTEGPAYAYPRYVAVVGELPLTSSRKIDKRALSLQAEKMFGLERGTSHE
jgi:acyl-CoA synthetase (AMP-forming)/AMP-acid ligase II